MSESEFLSHRMLPRIGREAGPGGKWGLLGWRNERRGLKRRMREMVRVRISQASMGSDFDIEIRFFYICDVVFVCIYID